MSQNETGTPEEKTDRTRVRTTDGAGTDPRFDVDLRGIRVDTETRCAHYHAAADIVAIRFPCCDTFYPCHRCHQKVADHERGRWPPEAFETPAVRCGACTRVLTIEQYLNGEDACPHCGADFNPRCARHHDLYFQTG